MLVERLVLAREVRWFNLQGPELDELIPHRPPFRLVDGVSAVDLAGFRIRGHRTFRADDLGFDGHFPQDPVYPGVLQLELLGQLGLCLWEQACRDLGEVHGLLVAVNPLCFRGEVDQLLCLVKASVLLGPCSEEESDQSNL